MSQPDYKIGERMFKEFMAFRTQFLRNAIANARFVSENNDGQAFRPVVLVSPRKLSDTKNDIATWASYVEALEEYPDLDIPSTLLYPLPRLITNALTVAVYNMDCSYTRTLTVEKILRALKIEIKRLGYSPRAKEFRAKMKAEMEMFSAMPADRRFRLRYDGYTDTICNVTYPLGAPYSPERVSANGLFFSEDTIKEFQIGAAKEVVRLSIYDFLPYYTASCFTAKVYSLEDIERAKAMLADYKAKHPRPARRSQTLKSMYNKEDAVSYLKAAWANETASIARIADDTHVPYDVMSSDIQ